MEKSFFKGSNTAVATAWATRNYDAGSTHNGNLYFKDRVIYSYRSDWPLAALLPSGTLLVNKDKYSTTTSCHLSRVIHAARGAAYIMYRTRHEVLEILEKEGLIQ